MAEFQALGGALPALTRTLSIVNSINRAASLFNNGDNKRADAAREKAMADLQARQKLEEKIASDRAGKDNALLLAQQSEEDHRRASALRAAVARQRALYGAGGSGPEGGSAEAVLLGLVNESDQEKAAQESIYRLRRQITEDNAANVRARNLLELSQKTA